MLYVSVTNTPGIASDLFIVVEKVDNNGIPLSPRIIWDATEGEFVNISALGAPEDAYEAMTEDTLVPGYYTTQVADIDVEAENLIVKVVYDPGDPATPTVIGQQINIPADVTPQVTLSFEVNEDRDS